MAVLSAAEIIESIKVSPLSAEELGSIMSAATTKIMANAFVEGGLDMMSDPNIWGGEEEMPNLCGVRGVGEARGEICARDEGHPYNQTSQLHRSEKGTTW
jgi:hypothetical protein